MLLRLTSLEPNDDINNYNDFTFNYFRFRIWKSRRLGCPWDLGCFAFLFFCHFSYLWIAQYFARLDLGRLAFYENALGECLTRFLVTFAWWVHFGVRWELICISLCLDSFWYRGIFLLLVLVTPVLLRSILVTLVFCLFCLVFWVRRI